jgi:protoporphyrinogen oxidase
MLELSESLSPYYWITISQKGFPFVLIIEHTNLVGLKGYNSHVVYLSRYLDANDSLFTACDESIINEFINHLNRVFPYFNENSIKKATLSRAKYSQPVTTLEYRKRIPDIKTPVKGLFLASMPQIYPEDRGLNYAVGLGKEAANVMLESL